ncbi:MAG: glycosyltransferase [Clostridia bacterium]|nr:glycosyltransferase [Clostridia bacterium]
MVKVLILTVTAGNAHDACAAGMKRELEKKGNCTVKIINLMDICPNRLNAWYSTGGYRFAVGKVPAFYDAFYKMYEKRSPYARYSIPSQGTILSVIPRFLKEILKFKPDVVYSTQFYGSVLITDLKLIYDLPFKSVTSTLDYAICPFWEAGVGVDYFNIPNEDFIDDCIYKGYKKEQLLPLGVPVDGRTLEKTDKKAVRENLGLDGNVFTVAVMFGGGLWQGGYKNFKQLVKALKGRKAQIIMINGRDEKSFKKINRLEFPEGIKVLNLRYTEDVPLYLSAADAVVNKAGGASVTEIVNLGIPMLVTEKLIMQEKYNLAYMKKKGVALSFKNAKTLKQNILKLMDDFDARREMSENTVALRKDAAGELAHFILSQPEADYSAFEDKVDLTTAKKQVKQALKRADKKEKKTGKNQ